MSIQPDLSKFPELSDELKKQCIDELNTYIWDNHWNNLANKKELIQQAVTLSDKLNYPYGIAFSILNTGVFYCVLESFEAVPHLVNALHLFQELNDYKGTIRALNALGISYKQAALYDKCMDYFQEVVSIAEKHHDEKYRVTAYINMANSYFQLGNYSQAKSILLNLLEISHKVDIGRNLISIYHFLGNTSLKLDEMNEALDFFTKALEICMKFGQNLQEPFCLTNLGDYYRITG